MTVKVTVVFVATMPRVPKLTPCVQSHLKHTQITSIS